MSISNATVRREPIAGSRRSNDYFVPALFAINFIHLSNFGTIYLVELALVVIGPCYYFVSTGVRTNTGLTKILTICALLTVTSMACPILFIGDATYRSIAKGLGVWMLFLIDLLVVAVYLRPGTRQLSRIRLLLIALTISHLLSFAFDPLTAATQATPWKFGFALPATLLTACLATRIADGRAHSYRWAPFAFLVLAIVNFALHFRSMSLFCVVLAIVLLPARSMRGRDLGRAGAGTRFVKRIALGALLLTVFVIGLTLYTKAASTGALGEVARIKASQQGASIEAVVVSSRPEAFVLLPAIESSPITGLGANAILSQHDSDVGSRFLQRRGAVDAAADFQPGQALPVHSHLLGSWAQYGVVAFVLWLFVLQLAVRGFLAAIESTRVAITLAPLIILIWDVLFSPFGADRRVQDAVAIGIASTVITATVDRRTQSMQDR